MRYALILTVVGVLLGMGAIGASVGVQASQAPRIIFTDVSVSMQDGTTVTIDVAHTDDMSPGDARQYARQRVRGRFIEPFTLTGFERQAIPVPVHYNPSGASVLSGDEVAVRDGHLGWNGITANFAYSYVGTSTQPASICAGAGVDGQNVTAWSEQGGSVLAIACWSSADECDIEVDPGWDWMTDTDPGNIDLETVMLHEAGHCLGLGHSADPTAVMAPSYHGVVRTPQPDDRAGVCAIYGCGTTPTSTPTRTATSTPQTPTPPTSTATPTSTPTLTPTPSPTPTVSVSPTLRPTETVTSQPPTGRNPRICQRFPWRCR